MEPAHRDIWEHFVSKRDFVCVHPTDLGKLACISLEVTHIPGVRVGGLPPHVRAAGSAGYVACGSDMDIR